MYVIAAANVPDTRERHRTDYQPGALFVARHLSKQERRVAFGVYDVQSDGAYQIATYLNGERTFTATSDA